MDTVQKLRNELNFWKDQASFASNLRLADEAVKTHFAHCTSMIAKLEGQIRELQEEF